MTQKTKGKATPKSTTAKARAARKKADPEALTPREELFCNKFMELMNASEAYRQTHNVRKTTKASSIHVAASKLMAKPKIAQRIAELQELAAIRSNVTVDSLTAELLGAQDLANRTFNPSALVSAIMAKAKLHGMVVDKTNNKHTHGVNKSLKSLMEEIDGQSRTINK